VEQIELRGVTKSFDKGKNKVVAVTNINLAIPRGSFVSITGPSASGKSTLLWLLGGLERPTAGKVWVRDTDLWKLRFFARRRFCKTTFAQIHRSMDLRRYKTTLHMVMSNLPRELDKEGKRRRAEAMLERVGLTSRAGTQPYHLSGGEQRRAALARALVTERPIVLAEEPTGQVDPTTAAGLLALMREINSRQGTTFIVVTESEALAREATRTIRLEEGRIVYDQSRTFMPLSRP
jgi:putative ABC transport system ATP-binding protein